MILKFKKHIFEYFYCFRWIHRQLWIKLKVKLLDYMEVPK